MDDYNASISAQDYGDIAWEREFSSPEAEREYTPPLPELLVQAPETERQAPPRSDRFRKALRYVAALTAGGLILAAAPAPLETVEVESYIEIACAAVQPEDPAHLYFRYLDYRSVYDEVPAYSDDDFSFYLVRPDGSEALLERSMDTALSRAVHCPDGVDIRDAAYSALDAPDTYFNLNVGSEVWRADIGGFEEGSALKIVCAYESEGVIKRMTSTREIVLLPAPPECTASLQAEPGENGLSSAQFVAVFHAQPGSEDQFVFGNSSFSTMGFFTRWYDAQGHALDEGWCFAAPAEADWPFPDVYLSGNDFVFLYQGPVRSGASNPAAAAYSICLVITEESSGWQYLFESETLPINT